MTRAEAHSRLEAAGFNIDSEPYIGEIYRVHRDGRSCGVNLGESAIEIVGHKENDPDDELYLAVLKTLEESPEPPPADSAP